MAKFKIEMSMQEVQAMRRLLGWLSKKDIFPLGFPEVLLPFDRTIWNIVEMGCEKHGILCTRFRTGTDSTVVACPKCNPKEYAELKKTAKVE